LVWLGTRIARAAGLLRAWFFVVFLSTATSAAAEPIGVIFPDIGEPYRQIFAEIIDGVEDQARQRVRSYPVGNNADMAELSSSLKRHGTKVVIALGRQGLKAAATLEPQFNVVVSGVPPLPDGERQVGVLMTPDPGLLFSQLKALVPSARRVIVVYNPQHNEWLVKLAREAARNQGLELVTLEARDLGSAARLYESAFANADARTDAVWLPIDQTTVEESTIMPIVLREAWNRNVAVFSSSRPHVKRGVLFALYPDNLELGRSLAVLAMSSMAGEVRRGVIPARGALNALNLRTALHIGLNPSQKVLRSFQEVHKDP
jgi:putative ABC transport system substrate-binding protein